MTTTVLTRDERQLLIAVRQHLRADGWTLYPGGARHDGAHLDAEWTDEWTADGKTGRVLEVRLLTKWGSTQRTTLNADVTSVQEAADLAVALGLLPQGMSSTYKAGIDATEAVINTPRPIPADFELALLRQANDDDSLDVAESELLDHYRTATYRRIIQTTWITAQAAALGWKVEANDLGDRLLILDRIAEVGGDV